MADAGRKKKPVPPRKTGKDRLAGVAEYQRIVLSPKQILVVRPLDQEGFAAACAKARSARLIFETKPKRARAACVDRNPGGRPVRHYRVILAADIAELMHAAGLPPKLVRGDQYEEAEGALFHRLFQLAQGISGDRVIKDTSRVLRAALDVTIRR